MADIKFPKPEKDLILQKLKMYFSEELNQEIGDFDAEFLLDFFIEEIGPYFYNRGLYDAQATLENEMDTIIPGLPPLLVWPNRGD